MYGQTYAATTFESHDWAVVECHVLLKDLPMTVEELHEIAWQLSHHASERVETNYLSAKSAMKVPVCCLKYDRYCVG